MKYAVMTTKHHDGFCLFDSQHTDYKATNTPAKRDLTREYVEAFRAEGLKVGFYYSVIDWHHPDYPIAGDRYHPMRNHPDYKDHAGNMSRYADYLHAQVKELLTNYGKIDVIWFDFSYDDRSGEAWRATELVKMVRALQPGIIIDNRLGGNIKAAQPEIYAGDFASPEQIIPAEGVTERAGPADPLGGVHHPERPLGLCQRRQELEAGKDGRAHPRRVRLEGRQPAPKRRADRQGRDPR